MMKLWIDDLRKDPDREWAGVAEPEGWIWVKTSEDAIGWLRAQRYFQTPLDQISFDHDLGGEDTTRKVLTWMIENEYWPKVITVHSANPVGRDWLLGTAERYAPEGVEVRRY